MNNFNNFQSKLQLFWSATWIDWVNLKGILGKSPSVHMKQCLFHQYQNWSVQRPLSLSGLTGLIQFSKAEKAYCSNIDTVLIPQFDLTDIWASSHVHDLFCLLHFETSLSLIFNQCIYTCLALPKVLFLYM